MQNIAPMLFGMFHANIISNDFYLMFSIIIRLFR